MTSISHRAQPAASDIRLPRGLRILGLRRRHLKRLYRRAYLSPWNNACQPPLLPEQGPRVSRSHMQIQRDVF